MRRCLAVDEKNFGSDHPNLAVSLNNLALLLFNTHRTAEAEPLFRRALSMDEKARGPDHPNVAIRLHNLGLLLHSIKRDDEAERLLRRSVTILAKFTRTTGHPHQYARLAIAGYRSFLMSVGKDVAYIDRKVQELIGDDPIGIA